MLKLYFPEEKERYRSRIEKCKSLLSRGLVNYEFIAHLKKWFNFELEREELLIVALALIYLIVHGDLMDLKRCIFTRLNNFSSK